MFLDPDNGIEVASVKKGARNSERYVYWDELDALYRKGNSLLVYQHFGRQNREKFMREMAEKAKARLGAGTVINIRTKNSFYLLAAQPGHEDRIRNAAADIQSLWGEHASVQHTTPQGAL